MAAGTLGHVDIEPGEEVFFRGHPSWRAMLGFYVKGLFAGLVAGVIAGVVTRLVAGHAQVGWVIAVVVVVVVLLLAAGQLRRLATRYCITSRRLTIETGLLSRDLHQTRLERVQNVNLRQSLGERVLRVGTVDFDTAAETEYGFSFRGVDDPRTIVRTVDHAMHGLLRAGAPPRHGP